MEIIGVQGLTRSYGEGAKAVEVLRGIDLSVAKGDTLAIVGASGVGKSTLLNILGTLDRPTTGIVRFAGKDVFASDNKALAAFRNKTIGFVFQFHHLLPEFTALENVMLPYLIGGGKKGDGIEKAEGLLREVGLGTRMNHKPGELSGGEAQRAAIVRAIMQDPDVILADEPTGNLDTRTGEEVFEVLMELNSTKGTTMAIVTHNERLAARMSRRIKMIDGRISEE